MPTLTRTWTTSQNISCSDQTSTGAQTREILFDIKVKLLAAGWTVTQSSDSSSSGSSDLWVDVDDLVYATGAGAHSWIVLKSPAGFCGTGEFIYYAMDYNDSVDYKCHYASRGDQDWTGLTTTSGPTDNDTGSINFWNHYTTNQSGVAPSALSDCKMHSAYSDVGDLVYYVSNVGQGQAGFVLILNKCSQAQATDVYPIVHYQRGSYLNGASWSTLKYSSFYHLNLEDDYNAKGFDPITGVGSGVFSQGATISGPSGAGFWLGAAASNTGDALTGKITAVPLLVACQYPASANRIIGQLTDMFSCQGHSYTAGTYWKAAIGDVVPGTGTITQGCVGGLWVPCSVAPDFS